MAQLSVQDYEQVLTFLQRLYAPECLRNWSNYLTSAISEVVAADIPGYCVVDFRQAQLLEGTPLANISGDHVKEVIGEHFHEDPAILHYLETQDCRASKLSDFVTQQQLYRMEGLYQNFLRPMGMEERLQLTLPQENSSTVDAIVLLRSERSFSERDRIILNLLLPHLIQARQTAQAFSQMQCSLNMAGAIAISKAGHIQFMTHKAEQWLQQYFSFNYLGQVLPENLQRWVNYQKSLFDRDKNPLKPQLPLKVEQNGKNLIARLIIDPRQDQDLILLEEQQQPKLSVEDFELLGLSKREAEVMYCLAKGMENSEIAEILHVSVTTIRKHLEHIYQKLEVKTRASAVVEALKRLGMLHCE